MLVIPAAKNIPTAFDRVRYLRIGSSKVNLMEYPEREAKLFDILRNGFPTKWCKKSVLYRAGRDTLQQRKILKKSRMTGSFFSGKSRN